MYGTSFLTRQYKLIFLNCNDLKETFNSLTILVICKWPWSQNPSDATQYLQWCHIIFLIFGLIRGDFIHMEQIRLMQSQMLAFPWPLEPYSGVWEGCCVEGAWFTVFFILTAIVLSASRVLQPACIYIGKELDFCRHPEHLSNLYTTPSSQHSHLASANSNISL